MGLLELLNILPVSSLSLNRWEIASTNRWPIFIQLYAVQHTMVFSPFFYSILISIRLVMGIFRAVCDCLGTAWPSSARSTRPVALDAEMNPFLPLLDCTKSRESISCQCYCVGIQHVGALLRNKGWRTDYQDIAVFTFMPEDHPEDRICISDCLARGYRCLIRCFALICRASLQIHLHEKEWNAAAGCECNPVCTAKIFFFSPY